MSEERHRVPFDIMTKDASTMDFKHPDEQEVVHLTFFQSAAEAYFSPDGKKIICNAQTGSDAIKHAYTANLDGTEIYKVNNKGVDGCTYFFPDSQRIIWASTRDNTEMPPGDYSTPEDYPQGAELYTSKYDGTEVKRLTYNSQYDCEVSVSNDGEWVLFTKETNGKLDLWKMRPDGSEQHQITREECLQPGGAFYMPDNKTILFRAWCGSKRMPMNMFTIEHDGTNIKQLTSDWDRMNWAPYPHPNGEHCVFVKAMGRAFDVYAMNIKTSKQLRLTYHENFDGFPSISPDGSRMLFSSTRVGDRMSLFLMDLPDLP